ncbi:NrdA Ribonucleotide reductase, alpha subunit [uncultured Caudovirales phage]|uniref:Ribonucleoside-diphosphate reductase n=1 Tax=uncultured Caudovirales phage TaxID=2100421 RepID=A0A6J5NUD5_9CAUD|nr:NrdA Ribonucleotide reductase, alpha subunit [uncultured Caudovirales phage]
MEEKEVNHGEALGWEIGVHFPVWANTEVYVKTVSKGYLLEGETPKDAYWRVASAVAKRLRRPELASKFFDYMWRGWLNLATPVFSNTGTERGLPISCFGIDVADSIADIGSKNLELMLLAKHGGGVGIGINQVRPAGSTISQNGTSDGVVPFCKIYDSSVLATNQGNVRRGAASVNIDIEHGDFWEWIEIREPKGEVNRQCMNLHQCVIVSDDFMQKLEHGDKEARRRWTAVLRKRKSSGEPYIMYKGNVNRQNPEAYKKNGLKVYMTNICSEITLHTDESHSFVCCLSSLNLAKYEEWKDTDLIYTATWFLDGVLEEFIQRAKYMRGFENSVRSAEKGRALGLGVLGWHTYLQNKNIPFDSLTAQFETRKIFSQIKIESERASRDMAREHGEPLWCIGTGMRNSHLRAIAPTVSNSKLSGNVSAGIEPWAANVFTEQTAKGTFIRKNPSLEKVLEKIGQNTKEVWDQILADEGSVQGLDFMDNYRVKLGESNNPITLSKFQKLPDVEQSHYVPLKDVYLTFKEINQLELVRQAGVRQQYIDQAVSLNLAFPSEAEPKFINQVHLEAYNAGIKTLYYMRTESVLRGDIAARAMTDCLSCDG